MVMEMASKTTTTTTTHQEQHHHEGVEYREPVDLMLKEIVVKVPAQDVTKQMTHSTERYNNTTTEKCIPLEPVLERRLCLVPGHTAECIMVTRCSSCCCCCQPVTEIQASSRFQRHEARRRQVDLGDVTAASEHVK